VRVIEHLRPLDDRGLADVRRGDLDRLAQRADSMRHRAPFRAKAPEGRSERDATLRRYLACFGIDSPPKSSSDRALVSDTLIRTLAGIAKGRPRPSLVHVLAGPPEQAFMPGLAQAIGKIRRVGTVVSWAMPLFDPGLTPPWITEKPPDDEEGPAPIDATELDPLAPQAADAVRFRATVAQRRSEAALMKMGVRVGHLRPGFRTQHTEPGASPLPGTREGRSDNDEDARPVVLPESAE